MQKKMPESHTFSFSFNFFSFYPEWKYLSSPLLSEIKWSKVSVLNTRTPGLLTEVYLLIDIHNTFCVVVVLECLKPGGYHTVVL